MICWMGDFLLPLRDLWLSVGIGSRSTYDIDGRFKSDEILLALGFPRFVYLSCQQGSMTSSWSRLGSTGARKHAEDTLMSI